MTESFMIAAFRSRQAVIRLDGALRRAGVKTEIVSTPRAVAVGCGLSVRFEERDLSTVRALSRPEHSTLIGFYRVTNIGGRATVQAMPT